MNESQQKYLGLSDDAQRTVQSVLHNVGVHVPNHDPRLLAVARTQMELGFMALNKAIANPANKISTERAAVPEGTQVFGQDGHLVGD